MFIVVVMSEVSGFLWYLFVWFCLLVYLVLILFFLNVKYIFFVGVKVEVKIYFVEIFVL